jgi:TRAP transporter 4TM/12TM fusion protein
MAGRSQSLEVLAGYLAFDGSSILGRPMYVAATIVIVFIFFGQLLNASRGSIFFTDLAQAAMGRYRGGPAKIAILGSALFGSISGSAVANVVATGVVTIPMIKDSGYPAHRAGAIEAVSSTGGQLMPPVMGAAAFLMADFLGVNYGAVVLAALLPGLLYYVALFFQADLEAARDGISAIPRERRPRWAAVIQGWFFVLPFAVLLIGIFSFNRSAQEAVLWACIPLLAGALALGYRGERPAIMRLLGTVRATGYAVLDIIMVCAGAGIVIGILGVTGLGFNFTNALVGLGEGSMALLLLVAAGTCILLGMGLPTVGVYVLLAALVAPALIRVGVEPMAAHLYVLYFGMLSMITPPVAIAAFFAASLAKSPPMKTGWTAVRFGWIAYVVPFLFVLAPPLLFDGTLVEIGLTFLTACFGIWLISIGIVGFFVRKLDFAHRLVVTGAGALALLPAASFEGAVYLDYAGLALGVLFLGYEIVRARLAGAPGAESRGA